MQVTLSILGTIVIAPVALIFFIWRYGLDNAKQEFKHYVLPISFFLPRQLNKTDPKIKNYFISESKAHERKISVFFTIFLSIWGFATAFISTTVEIIRVLGLESIHFPTSPIRIVQEPILTLASPFTIVGFLQLALLFGVPIASRLVILDRMLSVVAIRKIREHNIVQSVPSRNLSKISGLWGIAAFVFFFFHGILIGSVNVYEMMTYGLMFAMIIGIPIFVTSLFYTYEIEQRVQPKLKQYLTNDLGIRISSLQDMICQSKNPVSPEKRSIACLSLYKPSSAV